MREFELTNLSALFVRFFIRSYSRRISASSKHSTRLHTIDRARKDAAKGVDHKVEHVGKAAEHAIEPAADALYKEGKHLVDSAKKINVDEVKANGTAALRAAKDKIGQAGGAAKDRIGQAGGVAKDRIGQAGEVAKEKIGQAGDVGKKALKNAAQKKRQLEDERRAGKKGADGRAQVEEHTEDHDDENDGDHDELHDEVPASENTGAPKQVSRHQ